MTRLVFALLAAGAALLPAQDDRDRTTPVAAIWLTDQSSAELTNLINAGWRFTDIEIESTTTPEFTVAMVQNTGSYAKGWWCVLGQTYAQLNTFITNNNARIVDVETYDDNGTIRYTAILVSNTGADAKTWWWYTNQTSTQVQNNVNNNNGRLTSFDRYTTGGNDRWTTVMISNTGADQRAWGYFFGASSASIEANLNQYGNRIYGIERVAADSYDVIVMQNNVYAWWYYYDQTAAQVTEHLQQNIGRLIDIERHSTLLGTRFNIVMVDNANSLERTVRDTFNVALAGALGDHGFYLKEVNGPVLAEMRADTVFEPASTMKTLYHAHAMRRVHLGLVSLGQQINKPTSCGVPGSNQSLSLTLREMMENSDNYSTLAVGNYFGLTNIENSAGPLGMTNTAINFTIGCTGPTPGSAENQMTLRDLTALHETVCNGWLGTYRDNFYDLMQESLGFPSWGTDSLSNRINLEALALGLPNSVRDAFKNELHIAYKPGGIGLTISGQTHYYFAEGGWMSVPFKNSSGALTPREYTFGVFNYDFAVQEVSGRNAMCNAELDLVWNRVKAAMATWDNHVNGSITTIIGAGCPGSAGTPSHQATGTPEINASVNYNVANAPTFTIAIAAFGFDAVSWNGQPLPFNLAPVGAPGCLLRINAAILDSGLTTMAGTRSLQVTFPNTTSLIGNQLWSQYLVYDPPANAFDFTISNAVRTTLGGWQ